MLCACYFIAAGDCWGQAKPVHTCGAVVDDGKHTEQ